jgi:hypothetical protein
VGVTGAATAFTAFSTTLAAFIAFAITAAFAFTTVMVAAEGVPQRVQRETVGGIHAVDVVMTAGMM